MSPFVPRVLLACFVASCVLGCGNRQTATKRASGPIGTPVPLSSQPLKPLTTEQIAAKVLPSVVTLHATDEDTLGSGVLVDPKGKVLTCNHVVSGTTYILAQMNDGGYFSLTGPVAKDEHVDLAVVTLKGKNLPCLRLGDSTGVEPGQKVVAVGSPQGLQDTVTEGIVSAVREVGDFPESLRDALTRKGYKNTDLLIQFTAPISPGNSGGPLVNTQGDVIGIVAMSLRSGDNIYFAIPINEARGVLAMKPAANERIVTDSSAGRPALTYTPRVGQLVPIQLI